EKVAMGEIDHADDAIDHGVADGDQAVDRAEDDAVDELLGEIVHALPLLAAFSGKVDPVCRKENARSNKLRGDGPGSRNDASCHFLTVATRRGNSMKRRLSGLYRGSLGHPVPRPRLRQAVTAE